MPEARQHWNSRVGFVMAAVGSAVGLGNVWRFPYICGKYGGGAFLIPYFVAIILLGIPLLILEFGLGHMMLSAAPRSMAKARKHSEWIGWFAVLNALVITIYYVAVMAWCCNYFIFSFLPAEGAGATAPMWGADPGTFFGKTFLQATEGLLPFGALQWGIVIGYVFVWLCIFLIIHKGVGVVGKVVMWTVPLPVILLGVLLVREIQRPGAVAGISQYLTPDFRQLLNAQVWRDAFGQVFFSLTLGFGVMIAYASYLKKKSDIANNAIITTMANCGTSFFAGFVIFSTIGYLAQATGKPIMDVANEGGKLAFIIYPDAIRRLGDFAPVFGAIFFLMLLLLGIDSAFSLVEGAASALVEKTGLKHATLTGIICVIGCGIGMIYCTQTGSNWVDWTDHICNAIGLPLVMLLTCIVVGWLFGAHKLRAHINENSEIQIGRWWTFMIRVVCPLLIGFIFVATTVEDIQGILKKIAELTQAHELGQIEDLGAACAKVWGPYIGQWALLLGLIVISIILMLVGRRRTPAVDEADEGEEVTR